MEFVKLTGFALLILLVGMIVGIGVLVLDRISTSPALYNEYDIVNESITWPGNASNVSLARGNLTAFVHVINGSSVAVAAANYTVLSEAGKITALQNTSICVTGQTCYVSYTWQDRETDTKTTIEAARDALGEIATSWLSLIVLIAALSVVFVMAIRSIGGATRP